MVKFEGMEPQKTPLPEIARSAVKPLNPKALKTSNGGSRPQGLSPFPTAQISKFNWVWARNFVISLQTRYMEDVLKDPDMPSFSSINGWMERYPKFCQWVKRSRMMFADRLAERSASMFDEPPVMEVLTTKNGSYERISMSGVQRERYKSQAMFNLAAKFNPDVYGEKLSVSNTFDLSVVLNASSGGKVLKKLKRLQGDAIETQPVETTQPKPQ